ncbi:hypothetical protein [Kordia sp. SMS9]|uniref:hypothetical protein n=1 Tax=Kordia sp. SMS9 TaxID=2282170 RepID=UPI0013B365FC|nr:hypothetical protein [Kordia sp. SMS9]
MKSSQPIIESTPRFIKLLYAIGNDTFIFVLINYVMKPPQKAETEKPFLEIE